MAELGTSGRILAAQKGSPGIKKAGIVHVLTCKPGKKVGGFFSSEGRFLFLKFFHLSEVFMHKCEFMAQKEKKNSKYFC